MVLPLRDINEGGVYCLYHDASFFVLAEVAVAIQDTPDRVNLYIEWITSFTGVAPSVKQLEKTRGDGGQMLSIIYGDFPKPGHVTGFTYGLSLANHSAWNLVKRELTMTVRSCDLEWGRIPSRVAAAMRGICPFNHGQALGYAGRAC